jgi:hypothetical protein
VQGYVGLGSGGLAVLGPGSGLVVADYWSESLIRSLMSLTLEVSFAQEVEEELDEVPYVGSVGGNDGIQPVEGESSTEEVRQTEGLDVYRDPGAMDQKVGPTDHRDQMGVDHMTWEVGRSHKPPGGDKLVREVWRLDIRLWREVEESTDVVAAGGVVELVVGAALEVGLDVDGVDGDGGDGLWEGCWVVGEPPSRDHG